jgi:Fur family ferric uptake transcriptional regulator
MTAPAPTPNDALGRELHAAGLKSTAARLAVLRFLREAATPPSHGEIVQALESSPFSRATLYRNLIDLERAGLVRRTQLGEPVWRFEDASRKHGVRSHPHFLCNSCGKMVCLPQVDIAVGDVAGLEHALGRGRFEIQLRGQCDACGPDPELQKEGSR